MKTILLLEDLPEIRSWLKALVTQVFPNAQIVECARVHDALSQVSAQKFELALIDLGLPDGSGVDVVSAQGEPPLSPSIARKVIAYFAAQAKPQANALPHVQLTERESEVLLRVAKGFTLPEIGVQLGLSRHTIADYVKQIYRKLNVSSRAEAALEAQRLGLFGRSR